MIKIIYEQGDALSGPENFLAHGCNNRGVMGSGIALQIKKKYPKAYDYYNWSYQRSGLQLGDVLGITDGDKLILNCITQNGYGRDGKRYVDYNAISNCILSINKLVPKDEHVAMPKIGAGLGGGDWNLIERYFETLATFQPVVYIYNPK